MTEPSIFGKLAADAAWLTQQETDARDIMLFRSHTVALEQNHRLILLSAGIIGVVLPLVAQRPHMTHAGFMRLSWLSFGVCVTIGVVVSFFSRSTFSKVLALSGERFSRYGYAVGYASAGPPDEAGEKVSAAFKEIDADIAKKSNRMLLTSVLPWDVAFHGSFLFGLYFLWRAFSLGAFF